MPIEWANIIFSSHVRQWLAEDVGGAFDDSASCRSCAARTNQGVGMRCAVPCQSR